MSLSEWLRHWLNEPVLDALAGQQAQLDRIESKIDQLLPPPDDGQAAEFIWTIGPVEEQG